MYSNKSCCFESRNAFQLKTRYIKLQLLISFRRNERATFNNYCTSMKNNYYELIHSELRGNQHLF